MKFIKFNDKTIYKLDTKVDIEQESIVKNVNKQKHIKENNVQLLVCSEERKHCPLILFYD